MGRHHSRAFFDLRYVKIERRRAYRMAYMLFWSVLLYLVFQQFVVGVGIIEDRSMLPTLHAGEYYLINKYVYYLRRPQREEIVVLRPRFYGTDQYIKRVVGLPGETLEVRGGGVYINGRRLDEPYATGRTIPSLGPLVIPGDSYFVLGDNREDSEDSRTFGAVHRRNLDGKIRPGEWFPFR